MTKQYATVPTAHEWAKDMGTTGAFAKTEFPAFERIRELLLAYDQTKHQTSPRLNALKYELLSQVYRHTCFILKNKDNKAKLGTTLWKSRVETVQALHNYLQGNGFNDTHFADDFSSQVSLSGHIEDLSAVTGGGMQWYLTKADRNQFKISFRVGLAHRWTYNSTGTRATLQLYDTDTFKDAIEHEMALYVMDTAGRLFVSGQEGEKALKHSSFLAGANTLAAGTIRFEHGKLICISGKSGHYQPKVQQMLNALERLRAYQVDLSTVIVYRENYKGAFAGSKPKNFEPIKATTLLTLRAWLGEHPFEMRVG